MPILTLSPLALDSVAVSAEQRIIDCPSTVSDKQAISEPACLEAPQILLQSR
jgi:hypothetical protein